MFAALSVHEFDNQVTPDRHHRRWQVGDEIVRLRVGQIAEEPRGCSRRNAARYLGLS
jgi:hypothetical protein